MALEQRVSWFKKKALWKQEGSWYSSKAQQLWHNPKQNPASSQLLQYFASVDKNTGILISFNVFLLSTGYGRIIKVIIKLSVKGQSGTMRNNIGISGLCTAVFFCCIGYGRCLPVGMEQNSGPLSDDYQPWHHWSSFLICSSSVACPTFITYAVHGSGNVHGLLIVGYFFPTWSKISSQNCILGISPSLLISHAVLQD